MLEKLTKIPGSQLLSDVQTFFKESLDSLYNINSVGIKMMHKSLVTKHFQSEAICEIHEDSSGDIERDLNLDESVDMFNDEGGANSRLASRGWNIFWKSNKKLTRESPGMS